MSETVKDKVIRLWVSGLSSGQIAALIPTSRNCVVGHVYRAGQKMLAETGKNPYARPDHSFNTRNGLRYPEGYKPRAPKRERTLRVVTVKPPQIKREITEKDVTPGERLPPLVKLDQRLWISLPNTTPKDLLSLGKCECKWPLSTAVDNSVDSTVATLFCAAETDNDSSYCKTHRSWSVSKKPLAPLNFNKRAA